MTVSRTSTSPLSWVSALFSSREQDPRFRTVFEHLPAAFLVDNRTKAMVAVNGRATALTEWTRDELCRRTLADILAVPQDGPAWTIIDLLPLGSQRNLLDVPLRTRSGRIVPADLRLAVFEEMGAAILLMSATPVEERLAHERREEALVRALENINHLQTLLAAPTEATLDYAVQLVREMLGADAAGLYRFSTDAPTLRLGQFDGVPSGFPATFGPSEAQFLRTPSQWSSGQRPLAYVHQAARSAGWTHFMNHPLGEAPGIVGVLFAAYRPGNAPHPLAASLLPIAAQQLHHLISQIAREANAMDARSLAVRLAGRLEAVNAVIEEGTLTVNFDGTVDGVNGAAAQLLGFRPEDIVGLPYDAVLAADEALAQAVRVSVSEAAACTVEGTLHRRNGESFPAAVEVRPTSDRGCIIMLRDLSESRASQVWQDRLGHLAYVGQSTQSFAHDIRGPLNNISTGVQYLATKLPPDDNVQHSLKKIQAECQRLSDLMKNMLAFTKPVDPKFEPTDVVALLQRLLTRWNRKFRQQNVRAVVSITKECPPIAADPVMLERVFINLVDNALQAMPAGGHLSVSVRYLDRGPHGQHIEIGVGDSGPGIPEDIRRMIFDPYFTTKPDGTGLGLSICKRLVTVHRGGIRVESYPGAGTIFIVTLPVYDENRAGRAAASEATP